MRVRIDARHAHLESLHRAALGIQSVHARLAAVLENRVARAGRSPEDHLAFAALQAMQQQLDMILQDGDTPPIEKQRVCLDHALCRATDILVLLNNKP